MLLDRLCELGRSIVIDLYIRGVTLATSPNTNYDICYAYGKDRDRALAGLDDISLPWKAAISVDALVQARSYDVDVFGEALLVELKIVDVGSSSHSCTFIEIDSAPQPHPNDMIRPTGQHERRARAALV